MYQDHFGLNDDPFALGPNLRFLFRSRAHSETMAHLGYGLEQGEDIVLISGAIGTGKTLALNNLQAKVSNLFRKVLINVTQLTFREFLKMVLDELDETWPDGADTADLLVRLKTRATALRRDGRKILLVVDEAQNLESETLEGIRLLTNIGQPDQQIFQIVLSGQPGLEAVINRPELAQLRQRIRIHYRLESLSTEETGEYIAHRLAVAGRPEPLFTSQAIKKIHTLSGGVPRLVNHLAGHALLVAFVEKAGKVDARHVAADDMPEPPRATPDRREPMPPAVPAEPTPVAADQPAEPPLAPARPREPEPEYLPPPQEPARPISATTTSSRGRPWIWAVVAVVVVVGAWFLLRSDLLRGGQASVRPTQLPVTTSDQIADATVVDPPATEAVETAISPEVTATHTDHWLHVASFRDQERAVGYRNILSAAGVSVQMQSVTLPDGEQWLRVLVGPYAAAAAAAENAGDLEAQGLITFHRVIQR